MTQQNAAEDTRDELLKSVQSGTLLRLAPAVLFVGGLILAIGLATASRTNIEAEGRLQFERRAERLVQDIQRRIRRPVFGLKGARGMYRASENVTRREFQAYVESQELDAEYPGVLGFGFVERVPRAELDAHIARERADEAPDYAVHPASEDEILYVIKHVVPLDANRDAWGFNLGSEPRRLEAVERAIRTGQPAMTARIDLVQDHQDRVGLIYMVPIYKSGTEPKTPEEREASLLGLVDAPILIESALEKIGEQTEDLLRFDIYDVSEDVSSEVIFDFNQYRLRENGLEAESDDDGGRFRSREDLRIGGALLGHRY